MIHNILAWMTAKPPCFFLIFRRFWNTIDPIGSMGLVFTYMNGWFYGFMVGKYTIDGMLWVVESSLLFWIESCQVTELDSICSCSIRSILPSNSNHNFLDSSRYFLCVYITQKYYIYMYIIPKATLVTWLINCCMKHWWFDPSFMIIGGRVNLFCLFSWWLFTFYHGIHYQFSPAFGEYVLLFPKHQPRKSKFGNSKSSIKSLEFPGSLNRW